MKNIKKFAITTLSLAAVVAITSCDKSETASTTNKGSVSDLEEVTTQTSDSLRIFDSNSTISQESRASLIKAEYLKENNGYKDSDDVSVIVTLKNQSLVEKYTEKYSNTWSLEEYSNHYWGRNQKKAISEEQTNAYYTFKEAGYLKNITYSYDTLLNAISFTTKYGNLEALENSDLVSSVTLTDTYNLPTTTSTSSSTTVTINDVDVYDTGIFNSGTSYTGDGTVVAVLDSGFDCTHPVFNSDAINITNPVISDASYISSKLSNLKASETTAGLKAEDLYYSTKIPYVYDYADKDFDVNPGDSEHGTHVAGIIGAGDTEAVVDGKTYNLVGVAKNTQFAFLKVFSDTSSGAQTEDILAALEDAVTLGVDAINMSLGTSCGFNREYDDEYTNEVYDRVADAGITLVAAASNDYSAGQGGPKGNTNKTTNPDSGTVGTPSTYEANLSVASISGVMTGYMVANSSYQFFYKECYNISGTENDFIEDFIKQASSNNFKKGEENTYEYVVVPGVGVDASYSSINVKGKIALVKRGDNTFEEKVKLAKRYGAVAIIIYNNIEGEIGMSISSKDHIPTCSVTKEVGTKLVNAATNGKGTITINESYEAGPFMSDFSSWGPTPSLSIKPEITAHGGDILSSIPGGGYDRMSGTSMASPNMCGIVVLIRQYVKENASKFGLDVNENGEYDDTTSNRQKLTQVVNALLMSTATIANNEEGNPYSVRKQGAGLASAKKATTSSSYITVDGCDKPKLELGDDKNKTGVYEMTFVVHNVSNETVSYTLDLDVFSESVSTSDSDFVSEKAYMFDDATFTASGSAVSGKTVTISANSSVTVTVKLTLSAADKSYIEENFAYGMYVEGFVKLVSAESNGVSLNIPYLAFYGDWTEAPIFDKTFFEVETEAHNNAIDEDDKIAADYYATRPYGTYYYDYLLPIGTYIYTMDESTYTAIPGSEEHAAVSTKWGAIDGLSSVYGGVLRACKKMVYTVTDTVTGEVVYEYIDWNARKAYAYSGSATPYFDFDFPVRSSEMGLINNRQYEFKMVGYLDTDGDNISSEDNGLTTNVKNSFSYTFTMDDEAPVIKNATFEKTYDKTLKDYRYYLNLTVYDNHYVQALQVVGFNSSSEYILLSDKAIPVYGEKASDTTVKIEITDYMDLLSQNALYTNCIAINVEDYALNSDIFVIQLPGTTDSFKYTSDGTASGKKLSSLEVEVDSTINLYEYLYSSTTTDKTYFKYLNWTSSKTDVAEVKEGVVLGVSSGRTTITCTDMLNDYSQQITIIVKNKSTTKTSKLKSRNYSGSDKLQDVDFDYFITTNAYPVSGQSSVIGETGDKVFLSKVSSLNFYPGEKIKLHLNIDPWYVEDTYEATWSSTNTKVATVDQEGNVTGLAEGSTYITASFKGSTQLARVRITINDPFIIESRTLVAYKGLGGVVEIPDDEGIYYIGKYAFSLYTTDYEIKNPEDDSDFSKTTYGNSTVTKIIVPEGVEDIQKYAFFNCSALTEVVLPSTIRYIREYAFANCELLTTVNLEEAEVISDSAFRNCTSLTSVNLAKCYTIGRYTFYNAGLQTLDITKLRNTGKYAFANCKSLTTVTIDKDGLTKLAEGMFAESVVSTVLVSGSSTNAGVTLNMTQIPAKSFYKTNVSNVVVTNDIVAIGEEAFAYCANLASVEINAGLDYLNKRAFANCEVLTTITLPNSSFNVEDEIFADSTHLVTVKFQANTYFKTLGTNVLYNTLVSTFDTTNSTLYTTNDNLLVNKDGNTIVLAAYNYKYGDYTVDNKYTEVSTSAFSGIDKLTSVSIPASTNVSSYAFSNCANLTSVTLNGSNVSSYEFYNDNKLETIIGLANITEIGDYAFYGAAFETLTFNEVTLGAYSFNSNKKLTTVTFDGVSTVGDYAFVGDYQLANLTFNAVNSIISNYSFAEITALKSVVGLDKISTVGAYAFSATSLVNLNLATATKIGEGAFSNISTLTTVSIPNVTTIESGAFALTSAEGVLTTIDLSKVTTLGTGVLMNQSQLTSVTLNQAITSVPAYMFANCTSLTSVTFNGTVTSIGAYAFNNCKSLTSVDTSNVVLIESYAFANTTNLSTLTLTELKTVDKYAFGASGITSITANKLETISEGAFYNATKLATINASSVKTIEKLAFVGTALTTYTLSSTISSVANYAFYGANKLTAINYDGKTDVKVNDYATLSQGCLYITYSNGKVNLSAVPYASNITKLVVMDSTTSVSEFAGNGNANITSIVFPNSLKTIGAFAFYNCSNLTSVEFKSLNAPTLESYKTTDITNKLDESDPGYNILHKYTGLYKLDLYYANFIDLVGTIKQLTLIVPKNEDVSGYDSIQYSAYFGSYTHSNYVAMNQTSVTFIESMQKLSLIDIKYISLQDETLINTAATALTNLTDDLTTYGYSSELLEQYQDYLTKAKARVKELKLKTASKTFKTLQAELDVLDTTFTISRLSELNALTTRINNLKADEKSILDTTKYDALKASYNSYIASLDSVIEATDNVVTSSFNYGAIATAALSITSALSLVGFAIFKRF